MKASFSSFVYKLNTRRTRVLLTAVLAAVAIVNISSPPFDNPQRQLAKFNKHLLNESTRIDERGAIRYASEEWHSYESENIVPLKDRKKDDEIRYAAFGSSSTWGAQLPHRNKQTYVKVLSQENGDNYAIRSSGPSYPAACINSIFGDKEYDVIIFEYWNVAASGLLPLAQRLRQRFPDAIIVLLSSEKFGNYRCADQQLSNLFQQGRRDYGPKFCRNPEYKEKMMELFVEKKCEDEIVLQRYWRNYVAVLESISKETGAYLLSNSAPVMTGEGYLETFDLMRAGDCFHMSIEAHEDVATRIKALVDRVGVPKSPQINPFTCTDHCVNWFMSGEIDPVLQHNGHVEQMPNTIKYALTFDDDDDENEKWIEMTNESDETMFLFVSHMTTGPAPSNVKYPRASARMEGKGEEVVELDPVAQWGDVEKEIHVTKLTRVGEVKGRETKRVYFEIHEESEWPFRIVQVLLTPQADYGTKYTGNKEKMIA